MPRRTATTANAILGLLALRPSWPIYDLTKQLRRNMRFFWPRAESRIYDEAKALVDRGLAAAETTTDGSRARTTYSITDAGRTALASWLASSPRPTALECEPLLRLFLLDFGTHENVLAALDQLEMDAHAILEVGRVVAPEYLSGTATFQDQVHVRAFVFDFLSRHATMLLDWSQRTRVALAEWPALTAAEREDRAKALIETTFETYPKAGGQR